MSVLHVVVDIIMKYMVIEVIQKLIVGWPRHVVTGVEGLATSASVICPHHNQCTNSFNNP